MRIDSLTKEVGIGLRRNMLMTVAAVLVTAIALALFGVALLIRSQIGLMKGYWYDKIELSIFLCDTNSTTPSCADGAVTAAQRKAIQADLLSLPQVAKGGVYYESKQQAYIHFKEQFPNSAISNNITPDTLPESFRVRLVDPQADYSIVASQFVGRPGVDQVVDQRAVLSKLFDMLNGFRFASLVIAGIALVAMTLLIVVVIRVAAFSRRRETGIMRLVGASNLAIQLPFLVEGAFAGLVGGAIASLCLVALKWTLVARLSTEIQFTDFIGWATIFRVAIVLVLTGVVASTVVSYFALLKYLRV
jgi:cell division transport system permease protein